MDTREPSGSTVIIAESALWIDAVSEAFPDFDFSGCYDFDDLRKHMIGQASRLREERDAAINGRDDLPMAHVILAQLKAAEAECARLQQALAKIRDSGPRPRTIRSDLAYVILLQGIAREALAGPDTPAEPIVVTPDPDLYAYEGDPTGRDPRTKLGTEPGWKGLFRKRADSQPEDEA